MLPTQWTVIASDVLTILMAIAAGVDSIWHIGITTSPVFGTVLAILGFLGIHQTVTHPTTTTTVTPITTSTSSTTVVTPVTPPQINGGT